jgi:hypothetical protein
VPDGEQPKEGATVFRIVVLDPDKGSNGRYGIVVSEFNSYRAACSEQDAMYERGVPSRIRQFRYGWSYINRRSRTPKS